MRYKELHTTITQLFIRPKTSWNAVIRQPLTFKKFLYRDWMPLAGLLCLVVFGLQLIHYSILQSIGLSIIYFITMVGGFRIVYPITREYLCRKLNYSEQEVLSLIGHSYAIYFIFHSIGQACGDLFIGQVFILFSLLFIRTLYFGISELSNYQSQHQTNILIISALSIIFIPMLIKQLLTIIFGIPAIHV